MQYFQSFSSVCMSLRESLEQNELYSLFPLSLSSTWLRSVTIVTGFSVLVSGNQFFGDPIQCDLVSMCLNFTKICNQVPTLWVLRGGVDRTIALHVWRTRVRTLPLAVILVTVYQDKSYWTHTNRPWLFSWYTMGITFQSEQGQYICCLVSVCNGIERILLYLNICYDQW